MPVLFGQAARDGRQTPVLVRFVKLGRADACALETRTDHFQLALVTDGEVDVRGMVVGRATELIGVFDGCVRSLNGLLREWDIAARDRVQVRLGNLGLHGFLREFATLHSKVAWLTKVFTPVGRIRS